MQVKLNKLKSPPTSFPSPSPANINYRQKFNLHTQREKEQKEVAMLPVLAKGERQLQAWALLL
jgi:hypothetical protein